MRSVRKEVIVACIILFLLTAVYLVFLRWFFGPGQTLGAFLFLRPLEVSALIVIAALYWFICLGIRFFQSRRRPPATKISSRKRAAIIAVSLLLGSLGIFYGLYLHYGCVSLMQRAEVGHVKFTCSRMHDIEIACEQLIADADQRDLHSFFLDPNMTDPENTPHEIAWSNAMPDLLLHGRNASAPLRPDVRKRLGLQYLAPIVDGWGRPFVFSDPGPLKKRVAVHSLGPDGVLSKDDILQDSPLRYTESEIYDPAVLNRTPYARIYALFTREKLVRE